MVSAIIVAAGQGTTMVCEVDKLFLELDGCPIVAHTWRRFDEAGCIDEVVRSINTVTYPQTGYLADRKPALCPFLRQ